MTNQPFIEGDFISVDDPTGNSLPTSDSASSLYLEKWRVEKVLAALENGNPRRAAAGAGGVSASTLNTWINRYPDFADKVELAESKAVRAHLANINRAASKGNWLPSAWFLERRYPQEFGRVDRGVLIIREKQARELAEELRREGIDVSDAEVLAEYETLSKHKALPPGQKAS